MGFYYRTKTGIPGLYYSTGRGGNSSGITALVIICVTAFATAFIVFVWVNYLMFKYAFLGVKWAVLKINAAIQKRKAIE